MKSKSSSHPRPHDVMLSTLYSGFNQRQSKTKKREANLHLASEFEDKRNSGLLEDKKKRIP
jgi:hypothetical protein